MVVDTAKGIEEHTRKLSGDPPLIDGSITWSTTYLRRLGVLSDIRPVMGQHRPSEPLRRLANRGIEHAKRSLR